MIRRRQFITLVGGAAVWPFTVRAQEPLRKYRIAVVTPAFPVGEMKEGAGNPYYGAFFGELRRLGYIEGDNLVAERYSADGRPERYGPLADEVTRTKPDVIMVSF